MLHVSATAPKGEVRKMAKPKLSTTSKVVGRSGGKVVTEEDLDRIVAEAEAG